MCPDADLVVADEDAFACFLNAAKRRSRSSLLSLLRLLVLDYLFAPTTSISAEFLDPLPLPPLETIPVKCGKVYLLPAGEKHILPRHFISHFPLCGDPPRQRRARRNHHAHDYCVGFPIMWLAVPPTGRGPDVLRVGDLAASAHCADEVVMMR
jgi:hypothetical protein